MNDTKRFLEMMFPDYMLEGGHKIVLWGFPDKKTRWCETRDQAVKVAKTLIKDQNVYFGLGLINKPPDKGRGKEKDVTGLTTLYLDIDIDDGKVDRGKGSLPRSKKDAKRIIEEIGLKPSITVFSGHGYQAYWLFKEGVHFATDAERDAMKTLSRRWNDTARLCAHNLKFDVDSVFDLSRVFRLPGSFNLKSEPRVQCVIEEPEEGEEPRRYVESDFEELLAPEHLTLRGAAHKHGSVVEKVSPVLPDKNVGVPEIVISFIENDTRFKRTWERNRPDLKDQSPSAYDLSLASMLVRAGATDQDIANSIFAWRKKHNEDLKKAERRDYLMRTISMARSQSVSDAALDDVISLAAQQEPETAIREDQETGDQRKKRIEQIANISKALGISIKRIMKHGLESSTYSIELANGQDVTIGGIEAMFSQDRFRGKIADCTTIVIRQFKKPVWSSFVGVMLSSAVVIENSEATRSGEMTEWLERYLTRGDSPLFFDDEWSAAVAGHDPFVREGRIHVHCPTLRKFVRLDTGDIIDKQDMYDGLRLLGFRQESVNARHRGEQHCKSYWIASIEKLGELQRVIESRHKPARVEEVSKTEGTEAEVSKA